MTIIQVQRTETCRRRTLRKPPPVSNKVVARTQTEVRDDVLLLVAQNEWVAIHVQLLEVAERPVPNLAQRRFHGRTTSDTMLVDELQ
jgi:hypothetical protein